MNKVLISVIFILFTFSSHAQKQEKKSFSFGNLKEKEIVLDQPIQKFTNSYFDTIKIVDIRFDTSAIGFYNSYYFTLNKVSHAIEDNLMQSFSKPANNTGNQVILYVKKIWIGEQLQSKNISTTTSNDKNWQGGITCKIECYNKKDSLYSPLFKFDTTIISSTYNIKENASQLISDCLSAIANKISNVYNTELHVKANKINIEKINKYYASRFTIPILIQHELKKGVYADFEAFKNNTPTYPIYEINNTKLADIIYVKDSSGISYPIRNVWGYCDGKQVFIKSVDNYFPIYKVNNSFYLNGAKVIYQKSASRTENAAASYFLFGNTNSKVSKMKYKIHYSAYQLDMETGEIY